MNANTQPGAVVEAIVTTIRRAIPTLERLDQAQAVVDRHIASGLDGRCLACGQEEPCPARAHASATFAEYGRLPRRTPGLTGSGTKRVPGGDGFGWFQPRTTSPVVDGCG